MLSALISRSILIILLFSTPVAFGEKPFTRVWRISFEDKQSYLVGTDHEILVQKKDLPKYLLNALTSSRGLYLERNILEPSNFDVPEEVLEGWRLPQENSLQRRLPTSTLRYVWNLLDDENRETILSLKPGAALYFLLQAADDLRSHYLQDFAHKADTFGKTARSQEDLLAELESDSDFEVGPDFLELVEELFGGRRIDSSVIQWSIMKIEVGKLDKIFARTATRAQVPLHPLESLSLVSEVRDMIRTVNFKDFENAVGAIRERVSKDLGAIYFFDDVLRKAAAKKYSTTHYFTGRDDQKYVRERALIDDSPYNLGRLPGLETFYNKIYARHKNWLPRLERAFKQGDAFVAVGLAHVVGEKGQNTPGLLELLTARGFKIERVGAKNCGDIL